MSKAATKTAGTAGAVLGDPNLLGAAGTSAAVDAATPDIPTQDVPTRGDPANDVPKTSEQVATREQQQRMALVASGITSTANERDLLGGALSRRSASRLLLGGR